MTDFLLMVGGAVFAMVISGIVNYKKSAWVGLTDEEREELIDTYDVASTDYAQAIEAKLKEKNSWSS